MWIFESEVKFKIATMSLSTLVILVIIGLFTGMLAGMLGIGGGLIVIPALMLFMGFSQHAAQGTSLAMMLPPIGIVAAWNYYKAGHVDIKIALILAAAFIIGSLFGSKLAVGMSENLLKKIFSVFLILVAIKMLFWK
ncbi:MAG: sulfite exporter TauE/SafE family protein [Bacteroidales bacterium]|nr:sulfite exporter TauE/SafE family protein [Bacteroidales bacterium]